MSYEFYKVLHLLGMSLVLMSLGAVLLHVINGGSKQSNTWRKGTMITHGVGLLLLLVAGFGMLAKLGIMGVPAWVAVKLIIWLVLGGLVAVIYKKPALAKKLWIGVPALALIAAIFGIYHSRM
jgi:hypothetical protein